MSKKRLLSLLLSFCLVFGMLPVSGAVDFSFPADPTKLRGSDQVQYEIAGRRSYAPFQDAWNAAVQAGSGTVKLVRSVTANGGRFGTGTGFDQSGGIVVPAGQTVTLDLNGYKLDRGGAGGSVLTVNGWLNLQDSKTGGTIQGGNAQYGGGLLVRGTLDMKGGTVSGNTAANSGGGIYSLGTVTLSGGAVAGNTGGGFYQGGTLTVSGSAKISENKTASGAKQNIYLPANKTVTVAGLQNGAVLGVTTAVVPGNGSTVTVASGTLTTADMQRFPSDAGLATALENNRIVLRTNALTQRNSVQRMASQQQQFSSQNSGIMQTSLMDGDNTEKPGTGATETKKITITFNANGGELKYPQQGTLVLSADEEGKAVVNAFPVVVRTGYSFDGWYSAQTGGEKIQLHQTVTGDTTYYAQWTQDSYTVDFNLNGATESQPSDITVHYGEPYGSSGTLEKFENHSSAFLGWYLSNTGGQKIVDSTRVSIDRDHTLYALWKAEEDSRCTVTFHSGNSGESDYILLVEKDTEITLLEPEKYGFTAPENKVFSKWQVETGSTALFVGDSYKVTTDVTITAIWADEYTVTLDPNGGKFADGETTTLTVTLNQPYSNTKLPEPGLDGSDFAGWCLNKTSGKKITNETLVTTAHDHNLYALWDNHYEITFKAGDDATDSACVYLTDADGKIPSMPTPAACGFTAPENKWFKGWAVSGSADGLLQAGKEGTFTTATDVIAQWEEIEPCAVKFNQKGTETTVTYYTGEQYGDRWTIPASNERNRFDGWFTDATNGDEVQAGDVVTGDITLYAHWTTLHRITFYPNGGVWEPGEDGEPKIQYEKTGAQVSPPAELKKDGVAPTGWTKRIIVGESSTDEGIQERFPYTVEDSDVTFVAQWESTTPVEECRLIFDRNGGIWVGEEPENTTYTYGAEIDLPSNLKKEGFVLTGWYISDSEGGSEVYPINEKYTVPNAETVTLTAKWEVEESECTITYEPDGGTWKNDGQPDSTDAYSVTVAQGSQITLPANLIKTDYDLKGWFDTSDDETLHPANSEYTVPARATVTLKAKWEEKQPEPTTCTITFDPNDGAWSDGSTEPILVQAQINSVITAPANLPTRDEYEFVGWVDEDGNAAPLPYTVTELEDVTFYAKWNKTVFTVTFDAMGGSVTPITKPVTYGQPYGSTGSQLPTPTRTGYTFDGWYTEETGGTKVTNETTVEREENHTLYAHWTKIPDAEAEYIPSDGSAHQFGTFEAMWNLATADGGTEKNKAGVRLLKKITAKEGRFGTGKGFTDTGGVRAESGCGLELDLNGYTLDRGLKNNSAVQESVISVSGTLLLTDKSESKAGIVTGGYNRAGNGGGVSVGSSGTFTLQFCTISGNTALRGGGVANYGGSCYLSSGTITNNTAYGNMANADVAGIAGKQGLAAVGGGVYSYSSHSLDLSTVTISNNQAYLTRSTNDPEVVAAHGLGGGVYCHGPMAMDSYASVIGNHVSVTGTGSGRGAGIYFSSASSTFTMSGGTIKGNRTAENVSAMGGGVVNCGTFIMRGGEISGNSGYGGGGGVLNLNNFTMSGGDIKDNRANGNLAEGGGVNNFTGGTAGKYDPVFTMTGGRITGNSAYGVGGVIFAAAENPVESPKFIVSGQPVIKNNTSTHYKADYDVSANPNALIVIGDKILPASNQGQEIGVRSEDKLVDGKVRIAYDPNNRNEENVKYFFSNDLRYVVEIDEDDSHYLVLKRGETVDVVLNANGGTVLGEAVLQTQIVKGRALPKAVRDGYTFVGWFAEKDNEKSDQFDTAVEGMPIPLYAHWVKNQEKPTKKVLLITTCGEFEDGSKYKEVDWGDEELPTPKRDGYDFEGWFDDEGNKIESPDQIKDDTILVAHWKEKEPDKPDDPNNPDNPDDPNKPDTPDNPNQPDNPSNPSNPSRPSGGGSSGGSSSGGSSSGELIITASTGPGGTISPIGRVRVSRGSDRTFTMTPQSGYEISDVLVDDKSVGAVSRYTFEDIQRSHTIRVIYRAASASPAPQQNVAAPQNTSWQQPSAYYNCPKDSTCPIAPYADAQPIAWYHDGVHYCIDNGLMTGTAATTFEPSTPLSRAMLAQILYNRAGRPIASGTSFPDVVSGAWYENAVKYASGVGLVSGYENGNYGPSDAITREQLAVVLWRHAGSPTAAVTVPFNDFGATHGYAQEAIRWAYSRGIISGKEGNLLDPAGKASRAEVAQMLKSYFDSGF